MPYNLGSTLDSVCGACAYIYTSGASPMTLSPRDAANKKPYVFFLSGAQIVAQGIVSVNVGREKTGSKQLNSTGKLGVRTGLFCFACFLNALKQNGRTTHFVFRSPQVFFLCLLDGDL